jgi:hypothetical protein
MTPEKKYETEFFSTLLNTALMSKKDSSNCINTQKLAVSCTRLENYQKKDLIKHCSDLQLALPVNSDADIKGAPLCDELISI